MLSLILVKYRISPVLRLEHVLLNYKHAVALVPGDRVQLESGDRIASFVPAVRFYLLSIHFVHLS
jgi:hypothetical protein